VAGRRFSRSQSARGDRAVVQAPWLASTDPGERAILSELVRGGAMLALSLPSASLAKSRSPVLDADVWPLATGGEKSLREMLAAAGTAPRVLRWSRTRSEHPPPAGARPVFVLSPAEHAAIVRAVEPSTTIDYTARITGWGSQSVKRMPGGAACVVGTDDEAVIGWWTLRGKIFVRHWGQRVAELALPPELSACHVQVEDGGLVPSEDGKGTRGDAPGPYPVAAWHRTLATSYIEALAGSPPPELTVFADDPLDATFARAGASRGSRCSASESRSAWTCSRRASPRARSLMCRPRRTRRPGSTGTRLARARSRRARLRASSSASSPRRSSNWPRGCGSRAARRRSRR